MIGYEPAPFAQPTTKTPGTPIDQALDVCWTRIADNYRRRRNHRLAGNDFSRSLKISSAVAGLIASSLLKKFSVVKRSSPDVHPSYPRSAYHSFAPAAHPTILWRARPTCGPRTPGSPFHTSANHRLAVQTPGRRVHRKRTRKAQLASWSFFFHGCASPAFSLCGCRNRDAHREAH